MFMSFHVHARFIPFHVMSCHFILLMQLTHSFIHLFIHSIQLILFHDMSCYSTLMVHFNPFNAFMCVFLSSVDSFNVSFIGSFIQSLNHSINHSFNQSIVCPVVLSCVVSFMSNFTCPEPQSSSVFLNFHRHSYK